MTAQFAPEQVVHVTGCDIDWTGPWRAWDVWFSDCHARRHNKGSDGLSACCPGLTITAAEVGVMTPCCGARSVRLPGDDEDRCTKCGHRVETDGVVHRRTRALPPTRWLREIFGRAAARREATS